MSFYGPLMEEYLQARDRLWLHYFGGLFFEPLNNLIERPIAVRPQEIMDDPPPAPADEVEEEIDVVGLDEEEGEEPYRPDGEDEEEMDVAGLEGEEVLLGAEPRGDNGDAPHRFDQPDIRREEREEEVNDARAPSPPPLHEGPPAPPAEPAPAFAPPIAAPFVNPYAPAFAYAYAPYAPAYAAVNAPAFGYRYAPLAAPLAYPYFPPYDAHPADPPADADDTPEFQIPQLEPETVGPLYEEECAELFYTVDSLEEDPASPSTSGTSSKKGRSESEEESGSAARRLRWSDDSHSD